MDATQTLGRREQNGWGSYEFVQNRVNKATPFIIQFALIQQTQRKMEDANCKQWHEINKNADWMK